MRVERPLYLIFLMIAGAHLQVGSPLVLVLAVGYALIRALSHGMAGGVFLRRVFPSAETPPTRTLGLGLLSQAGIGVALAVHFHLWIAQPSSLPILEVAFSVLLVAIILNELASPLGLAYVTKEK